MLPKVTNTTAKNTTFTKKKVDSPEKFIHESASFLLFLRTVHSLRKGYNIFSSKKTLPWEESDWKVLKIFFRN